MDGSPAHQALRAAAAAADAAIARGSPWHASEALVRLGCRYRDAGELNAAIASFEQALPWTHLVGTADASVDLLCTLAECATDLSEDLDDDEPASGRGRPAREIARRHVREAWTLAARTADPRVEVRLLLRACEVLTRLGDHADAIALQTRVLELMRGDGAAFDLATADVAAAC